MTAARSSAGDAVAAAGADLPVAAILPALLEELDRVPNAVLVAPPGAGKTTLVPLALLDARWRGDGRIVVLEPRRLAARAAATRMASLLGETVGGRVGFRTRIDAAVSAETRIEVVTEGLLVARLLAEPTADGVAAIVLDEIHERSLDADLALALALDLQRTRPELRLLAMSATADAASLAAVFGPGTPVHRSEGRAFPVTVRQAKRDIAHPRDLPDAVARAVRLALSEHAGDVLAFLPGKREIERTARALDGAAARVLPLHGELPPAAQDEVLRPRGDPAAERRVVLATNVAETSLTVPGITVVVDAGVRRAPRLDAATGLARLTTLPISRAGADQRAGRAGRLEPGTCYRLWSAEAHRARPPFDRPEILEADLAGLALALASWEADWGTPPDALRFADRPPEGALAAARSLLADLGALDAGGAITATGRAMRRLGTHPRLASLMLAAGNDAERARAANLAALLEERDPLGPANGAAIALRLAAIEDGVVPEGADRGALGRIRDLARQFRRRLGIAAAVAPDGDPAHLLTAAFPDRVGGARGEPGTFRLAGGGTASLPPTDPLSRAALLVAPGLHAGRSTRITLAAPLDPDRLPASLAALVTETVERGVDERTGTVFARRRTRLRALVLADRTVPLDGDDVALALAEAAAPRLEALLDWTDAARSWQGRARLAREAGDGSVPSLEADALAGTIAPALARPIRAAGISRLDALKGAIDAAALLRHHLGGPTADRLERLYPGSVALPHGRATIDYAGPRPVASARAQAFYGLDRQPTLGDGRTTVAVSLLSPAGRPIAVTGDLPAFWRGGWADARRDMRGRYPRHDWPDEPWHAPARG